MNVLVLALALVALLLPLGQDGGTTLLPPDQYAVYLPVFYAGAPGSAQIPPGTIELPPATMFGAVGGSCEQVAKIGATWRMVYGPRIGDCPGVDDVSMIRDELDIGAEYVSDGNWLMAFNEVDIGEPGGCGPWDITHAATRTRQFEQMYPGIKKTSISFTHWDYTGLERVYDRYIELYGEPPQWGALSIHCFQNSALCVQTIGWAAARAEEWAKEWPEELGDLEVWVTEYSFTVTNLHGAGLNWQSGLGFMDKVTQKAMAEPRVRRIAWWEMNPGAWSLPEVEANIANAFLYYPDGLLTPLGERYREYALGQG